MTKKQAHSDFINPEQSWLAFNARVLAMADNEHYPLLERIRFLSISANNLDEFYMVHLGRLQGKIRDKEETLSIDELGVEEQIETLQSLAMQQISDHVRKWRDLRKRLRTAGVDVISPKDLSESDKEWLEEYFLHNIFPVLTPMALDASHPVPLIPSRGMAIAVQLLSKKDRSSVYAFIPLPNQIHRFIELPGDRTRYIAIDHVITLFLGHLFSNYDILAQGLFRIVRNAEMQIYDNSIDLRDEFEDALARRLHGSIVQLCVNDRMPEPLRFFVAEQFDVDPAEVVVIDGFLGINEVDQIISSEHGHLLFPPFTPRIPQRIMHNDNDILASIAIKDILIHHPYESFDVIVMLLKQAAQDKDVVAIKQTLYRTGANSRIVAALIEAAKAGKSVTALVEIKARFDEEANIRWTKDLENAGVHVIYGVAGLKTHAKLCLIMRKEEGEIRSYAHFGTGNYNSQTALVYSDLSLLTADPVLCQDAARIFHYMTGYARLDNLQKIYVAPSTLRQNLEQLIQDEMKHAKAGKPAQIWIKMNALTDKELIKLLYKASNAGVKIDLIIRGMCSLIPGVPGMSENIHVRSLLGRFLEHSRIFCFGNKHALPSIHAKVFMSSADLMPRNLDWRLELMIPIDNPTVHRQILEQIMTANLNDTAGSWELRADGNYYSLQTGESDFSAQDFFMQNTSFSGTGVGPYPITPRLIKSEDTEE